MPELNKNKIEDFLQEYDDSLSSIYDQILHTMDAVKMRQTVFFDNNTYLTYLLNAKKRGSITDIQSRILSQQEQMAKGSEVFLKRGFDAKRRPFES